MVDLYTSEKLFYSTFNLWYWVHIPKRWYRTDV